MSSLRVLVACEYSATVRDAFIHAGHDAMSCDLLPSESQLGPHHLGNVFDVIDDGWDLLVAHPPCTYLTLAGVRWLHTEAGRWEQMIDGALFFRRLLECDIPRVAVENPIMHRYARKIIGPATRPGDPAVDVRPQGTQGHGALVARTPTLAADRRRLHRDNGAAAAAP